MSVLYGDKVVKGLKSLLVGVLFVTTSYLLFYVVMGMAIGGSNVLYHKNYSYCIPITLISSLVCIVLWLGMTNIGCKKWRCLLLGILQFIFLLGFYIHVLVGVII